MSLPVVPVTLPKSTALSGWDKDQFNSFPLNNSIRAYTTSTSDKFILYLANLEKQQSDAAVGLPVAALGTKYIVMDYDYQPEFVVTAVKDNTEVTIRAVMVLGIHPAGIPFTFTLNRGESFFGFADTEKTLSGTEVEASKPVTLTNGNVCSNVPQAVRYCDHIFQVAQPVQTWGRMTAAVNLPLRPGGSVYRVFASEDNTVIRLNSANETIELNKGNYTEIGPRADSVIFKSEKPFFVVQFMTGAESPGAARRGDPSMGNMIPLAQYLFQYTFATLGDNQFDDHYLSIVTHVSDVGTLTLDGVPILASHFTQIDVSEYYAAVLPITEGVHTTASTNQGHGITVEGFGRDDSYLYPGGALFASINV